MSIGAGAPVTRPYPGGPRYDDEWADVLAAEKRAELRRMSDAEKRAARLAQFFYGARAGRP
jgi:hypothetical protein